MTPVEIIQKLPDIIAEAETARGKKFSDGEVGDYLVEIGQAIKSGNYGQTGITGFLAHDPTCSTPRRNANDPAFCDCGVG